jgi:hypothetical protein
LFGESSDVQIEEPVVPPMKMEHDGENWPKERKWLDIYMDIHWMIINLK